ncbi:MAG: ribosome maturation factor RimM [Nitrospirota bacterium]
MKDGLISIGKILKVWGIRGEVKILPLTDNPHRYRSLKRVISVTPNGSESILQVGNVKFKGKYVMLSFKGYDTSEKSSPLVGSLIKIPKEELEGLPEGSYYIFELIGANVFSVDGRFIGKLTDVITTGSNDVYVVEDKRKEILIPAIKDVVKEIDIKKKTIIVQLVNGLDEM